MLYHLYCMLYSLYHMLYHLHHMLYHLYHILYHLYHILYHLYHLLDACNRYNHGIISIYSIPMISGPPYTELLIRHNICGDCWSEYLTRHITENPAANLECPGYDCTILVPNVSFIVLASGGD